MDNAGAPSGASGLVSVKSMRTYSSQEGRRKNGENHRGNKRKDTFWISGRFDCRRNHRGCPEEGNQEGGQGGGCGHHRNLQPYVFVRGFFQHQTRQGEDETGRRLGHPERCSCLLRPGRGGHLHWGDCIGFERFQERAASGKVLVRWWDMEPTVIPPSVGRRKSASKK